MKYAELGGMVNFMLLNHEYCTLGRHTKLMEQTSELHMKVRLGIQSLYWAIFGNFASVEVEQIRVEHVRKKDWIR